MGLGHTMLRTTHEAQFERQPASLDGRLCITADARIDCREELEKKLEQQGRGAAGRTVTDSDLILHAYAAWGAECVQHLRGDFAFAIWDARKKLLFCARDHFGVKPFYYSELGELFLFSNTLDCLRQHPGVSAELNDAAIGDFLLFGLNCDVATTTFRDIRRLPAAHAMTISSEGLRIQRYWSAPTEGRIRYRPRGRLRGTFSNLTASGRGGPHARGSRRDFAQRRLGFRDNSDNGARARRRSGWICVPTPWSYESSIPDQEGRICAQSGRISEDPDCSALRWIICNHSSAGTTPNSARLNLLTIHFSPACSTSSGRSPPIAASCFLAKARTT